MSYTDAFHDYISDIPMDMSKRFYPTQNITVDMIPIPRLPPLSTFEYSFEAESRAREQFDKQNESVPQAEVKKAPIPKEKKTLRSESAVPFEVLSQDVLVPVSVNSAPSLKPLTPNTVSLPHSLHEFESTNNVFDDVQILALDDKKALQEVLMSTSANPQYNASPNSLNNNHQAKSVEPEKPKQKEHEDLRTRLLTKGYRKDIVEKALENIPKNRLVHIEYYMKACRTVEKTGRCSIDDMLPFLITSNLTDKKVILNYSESCAALLKMGFDREQVFNAVKAEQGDQAKAVNRLLTA